MKLDSGDIGAVARYRVNRVENKKTTYWMIVVAVLVLAGVYVVRVNTLLGWVLCVAGVVGFVYYQNIIGKKAVVLKSKLMKEWQEEQKSQSGMAKQ